MNLKNIPAKMIVIDGVDGAGKGLQSKTLYAAMQKAGLPVILTREPGGSPGAEEIRRLLVEGDPNKWDAMTELLLVYAARRSHLCQTVWPALEQGTWVISDRFADSSRAFQGIAGGLGLDLVNQMHQLVVDDFEPDLTFILDVAPEISLARAKARGDHENRFEQKEMAYHEKVRLAFLQCVEIDPHNHVIIDASVAPEQVSKNLLAQVNQRFNLNLS